MKSNEESFSKEQSIRVADLLARQLQRMGFHLTEVERNVLHARNGYFAYL